MNGPEEVRSHVWLNDVNWKAYENKSWPSPFIPDDKQDNYLKSNRLDSLEDKSILHNE